MFYVAETGANIRQIIMEIGTLPFHKRDLEKERYQSFGLKA